LRKKWTTKVKDTSKNQFANKKSNNCFATDKILQRSEKKDGSCISKRQQKQANYFEINHISTVLN